MKTENIPEEKKKIAIDAFRSELELLSSIRHKNIVRLYGYVEDLAEKSHILLMELCDNSLSKLLKTRKEAVERQNDFWFSELIIGEMCLQILSGLVYLHSNTISHRDLKVLQLFFWNKSLFE